MTWGAPSLSRLSSNVEILCDSCAPMISLHIDFHSYTISIYLARPFSLLAPPTEYYPLRGSVLTRYCMRRGKDVTKASTSIRTLTEPPSIPCTFPELCPSSLLHVQEVAPGR